MSRNRTAALLVTGSMLVAPLSQAVAAADPTSPLYRLVDTAAQRLATADPVAASKWLGGGPITDATRANQVLDNVGADAAAHGVDPQYVRTVFTDQIGATEGLEYTRFGQWKFDPSSAPATAPDLSASRAAIDGFNKTMVDEIALQWNSLHAPTCSADVNQATDAVATDRRLDPLYRQALSSATRSYCAAT
ncbi:chorismate mutase [Mycolicibacterium moriokaense]|nr:chorismate mutase [Mycolicibacterium moriokaense]